MLENLQFSEVAPLSITSLVINLLVGSILSILLKFHYKRFGSTITNREEFSNVFSFVLLTTVLVISIVKSSLALSLGLVGALSIVRFRTPIKEPEELAYLFISIAAGLGLGANQTIPTIISIILILLLISLLKIRKNSSKEKNMYVSIEYKNFKDQNGSEIAKTINEIIRENINKFDLRRLEVGKNFVEITYLVNIESLNNLEEIIKKIQSKFSDISITYIDQNQVPSV